MQVLQKDYIPHFLRPVLVPLVNLSLWCCSRVLTGFVAATELIGEGFPPNKTVVVRNFPPVRVLEMSRGGLPIEDRNNVVVYVGGLSRERGIGEAVEAFRQVKIPDAELWLVGPFYDPSFQRKILSSLPPNVKWLGQRPYSEVFQILRLAKVGIVLLHDTPAHKACLPIKLFEYLGAGIPVIASDMPHLQPVVEGCGVQVNPLDVEAIAATVARILSDTAALTKMSRVGRERVASHFSWEPEGQRLVEFCSTVLAERGSPPKGLAG
jgi:glycosyltransferase involved in cell wall biosynthesis